MKSALSPSEICKEIRKLKPFKAPGYDLVVGEILKHLSRKAVVVLTAIFNSILRLGYFPIQWKYAQFIMILKHGKPPTEPSSYRPISLQPIMAKLMERLLLNRTQDLVAIDELIPPPI